MAAEKGGNSPYLYTVVQKLKRRLIFIEPCSHAVPVCMFTRSFGVTSLHEKTGGSTGETISFRLDVIEGAAR